MAGIDRIALRAYRDLFIEHADDIVADITVQGMPIQYGVPGTSLWMVPSHWLTMGIICLKNDETAGGVNVSLGVKSEVSCAMQLALTMKAISDQSDVYPFERSEAVLDLLALRACDILYRYGSSFRYAGFPIDRKDATVSIQDQSQFVEGDDLEEPQIILSRLLTFRVDMSYTSPTIYTPAFVEAMGLTERN